MIPLPNSLNALLSLPKAQVMEIRRQVRAECPNLLLFAAIIQNFVRACESGSDHEVRLALVKLMEMDDKWNPTWSPGRPSQTREERAKPEKKKGIVRQRGTVVPPHDQNKHHVQQVFDATPYDTGKIRYSDPKDDPFLLDPEDDIPF